MSGEWKDRPVTGIVLSGPTSRVAAFARTSGGWQETRVPTGIGLPAPSLGNVITADELIELLRGPLGATRDDDSGEP